MDDIHESRRARAAAARGGIGPEHDRVLFGGEDVVHVGLVCALGELGELREHTDHCLFALVLAADGIFAADMPDNIVVENVHHPLDVRLVEGLVALLGQLYVALLN